MAMKKLGGTVFLLALLSLALVAVTVTLQPDPGEQLSRVQASESSQSTGVYTQPVDGSQESSEQAEKAFSEIVEYLRVGVLLIYEELAGSRDVMPAPPQGRRLH